MLTSCSKEEIVNEDNGNSKDGFTVSVADGSKTGTRGTSSGVGYTADGVGTYEYFDDVKTTVTAKDGYYIKSMRVAKGTVKSTTLDESGSVGIGITEKIYDNVTFTVEVVPNPVLTYSHS